VDVITGRDTANAVTLRLVLFLARTPTNDRVCCIALVEQDGVRLLPFVYPTLAVCRAVDEIAFFSSPLVPAWKLL